MDYPVLIEKLAENFANSLDNIIELARQEYVIPFCDSARVEFNAGMGSWMFQSEYEQSFGEFMYSHDYEGIPEDVLKVLQMEYPLNPGQSCGSMMQSYTPKNFCSKL